MTTRHKAREIALQMLYRYDNIPHSELPGAAELAEQFKLHFAHFAVHEDIREFTASLVSGAVLNRPALDEKIAAHAANWTLERMALIDRNLIRLATYELMFCKDTPASVVIDEAVELSKDFGSEESSAFVNGILDAIRKSLS